MIFCLIPWNFQHFFRKICSKLLWDLIAGSHKLDIWQESTSAENHLLTAAFFKVRYIFFLSRFCSFQKNFRKHFIPHYWTIPPSIKLLEKDGFYLALTWKPRTKLLYVSLEEKKQYLQFFKYEKMIFGRKKSIK